MLILVKIYKNNWQSAKINKITKAHGLFLRNSILRNEFYKISGRDAYPHEEVCYGIICDGNIETIEISINCKSTK